MSSVSTITVRVRYAETDQMGVVYHANYLVWCDMARTEHLRELGQSYRDLEASGTRLAVTEVTMRYRQPARFDDVLRVQCWVREVASRRVVFGYALHHDLDGGPIATAQTTLIALDSSHAPIRLPSGLRAALDVVADPVRL